jgi:hypothetical protein
MKNLFWAVCVVVFMSQGAFGQGLGNTSAEFYYPGYGWYNPNLPVSPNYSLGHYQYYGGGMWGNAYYGPTPFQRNFYGIQDEMRFRVGPNVPNGFNTNPYQVLHRKR